MRIQTSVPSYLNFNIVVDEIINGLKFSIGVGHGSTLVSIDEHLELDIISRGSIISAAELIEIMGEDTFMKMMTYLLDPTYYHNSLDDVVLKASSIIRRGFRWNATPEGWSFWQDIANQLDLKQR